MGISVPWTPTDMLSQSNQNWFAQKVEKYYVSEEVIFLWIIKVIWCACFNSDDLISEVFNLLFTPLSHLPSDFCRNASSIAVGMSLVFQHNQLDVFNRLKECNFWESSAEVRVDHNLWYVYLQTPGLKRALFCTDLKDGNTEDRGMRRCTVARLGLGAV